MKVNRAVASSNPTHAQRRWLWARYALCICAIAVASGCASTQQRGDRAYKSGRYEEALDHYERAIEAGDTSVELYTHAAEAALRIGDFSLAERYFDRAMQSGGGESVARKFADFYIATSNYTKAVRLLQTILETTDDPQTVFNDLGAALMYAGSPLNAESYLMVAQQMMPKDPVPYVNLGVLYDKHLHKPRLAFGFYRCFLEMSPQSRQVGKVQARVAALEGEFGRDVPQGYSVPCGEPYQPVTREAGSLKGEVARRLGNRDASADTPPDETTPQVDTNTAGGDTGQAPEITIDRGVEEPKTGPSAAPAPKEELSDAQKVTLAQKAFANHNHAEAVELLESIPADAFTTRVMGIYGQSLASVGELERARRWLGATIAEDPAPAEVQALWTVFRELNNMSAAQELCERFEGTPGYGAFLRQCATAADSRDQTPPAADPGATP